MTTVILVSMALSTLGYQPSRASIKPEFITSQSEIEYIAEVKQPQWNKEELHAIAQTLAGECYDDKELDKRRVCEVILNRVSNSKFANSILEVLTTSGAFNGYWKQSRPISKNDYAVAEKALQDWYAGGCKPLSEWLFFSKGSNRENVFRSNF